MDEISRNIKPFWLKFQFIVDLHKTNAGASGLVARKNREKN